MPEQLTDDNELLNTRPSLRPDSVNVYAAFYNSVEVVYPVVQPDRAVRSTISYVNKNNEKVIVEVTDFNKVILIEDLEQKEYVFDIIYYTAEGKASNVVKRRVTPYLPLTDYIANSMTVDGSFGNVYAKWKNITTKELEVEVKYVDGSTPKSIKKLTSTTLDSIIIEGLANVNHDFVVIVRDLAKNYETQKEFMTAPGISVENYALQSLTVEGGPGEAKFSWKNDNANPLKFDIKVQQNGVEKSYSFTSSEENGSYSLIPLAEGNANISVQIENINTKSKTTVRSFLNVVVTKSPKDYILSEMTFTPYANGLLLIAHKNTTSVSTTNKLNYTDESGLLKSLNISSPIESSTFTYTLLTDVKDNSKITFEITDNIGTDEKSFTYNNTSSLLTASRFNQSERDLWTASASSFRNGPTNLDQGPAKTLDGIYSESNSGTVTTTQWVNEWGNSQLDATGTPSNVFPHFLGFDFKSPLIITAVQTYNVGGSQVENGALNFNIEISDNGKDWTVIKQTKRTVFARGGNEIFTLDKPVVARYLRLYYLNSSGSAGNGTVSNTIRVAEFFAYGLKI